tara:strand:+ start:423 stop:641 length:219 start_codon:yes stop_codon:yes gene_type:complete
MSHDVIIASIGARYQSYCGTISRTYLVDPCKKITKVYDVLVQLQAHVLEQMVPGKVSFGFVSPAPNPLLTRS